MAKQIETVSRTRLRKQLGEALRSIRLALHGSADGAHRPVEFMGYRFHGRRVYKAPGQIGYAWNADYVGEPCTDWTESRWPMSAYGHIGGTMDECATQLHARLREEAKAGGVAA